MDCRGCNRCDKHKSFTSSKYESDSEESHHRHHVKRRRYSSSSNDPDGDTRKESQHRRRVKERTYSPSSNDPHSETLRVDYQKSQERKLLKKYYQKSNKYIEMNRLEKALSNIEKAIMLCDQGVSTNDKILSQLYSRRGTIRTLLEMPRLSFQGFLDFERGLMIDKSNEESRINMSKYFSAAGNKFFKMKDYVAAAKYSKCALRLYSENAEACDLIEKITRKEKRNLRTMDEARRTKKDLSSKKHISENRLKVKSMSPKVVKDKENERKSLYKLLDTALKLENYTRAIIYVNQLLSILKDLHDDEKYRELLEIRQKIKKFIKPVEPKFEED